MWYSHSTDEKINIEMIRNIEIGIEKQEWSVYSLR